MGWTCVRTGDEGSEIDHHAGSQALCRALGLIVAFCVQIGRSLLVKFFHNRGTPKVGILKTAKENKDGSSSSNSASIGTGSTHVQNNDFMDSSVIPFPARHGGCDRIAGQVSSSHRVLAAAVAATMATTQPKKQLIPVSTRTW